KYLNEDGSIQEGVREIMISEFSVYDGYVPCERTFVMGWAPVQVLVDNTKEDEPWPYSIKKLNVYLGCDTRFGEFSNETKVFFGFGFDCSDSIDPLLIKRLKLKLNIDDDGKITSFMAFRLWDRQQYYNSSGYSIFHLNNDPFKAVIWMPIERISGPVENSFLKARIRTVSVIQVFD
ncbi:hypothetical protein M3P05_10725, partial [Sansalvadorimonas sp. 2012CJ34-2]